MAVNEIEKRLEALGFVLPQVPQPGGVYTPVREFGVNLAYLSGVGCNIPGGECFIGKVGGEISADEAQRAARQAALNALAVLKKYLGSLSRVKSIVKILGFVASADTFYEQPLVINGASGLFCDVFGERIGKGARSAIGVNVLPGNIPVEIEMMIELNGGE